MPILLLVMIPVILVLLINVISYMWGAKLAHISRIKKDGTLKTIGVFSAISDIIIANIATSILVMPLSKVTFLSQNTYYANSVISIGVFLLVLYFLLKPYNPTLNQYKIVLGVMFVSNIIVYILSFVALTQLFNYVGF